MYDHTWLDTSPEDILTGQYPVMETSIENYPVDMWEFAPLLRSTAGAEIVDGSSRSGDSKISDQK